MPHGIRKLGPPPAGAGPGSPLEFLLRTRPFLLAAGLLTSTLALAAPTAHAAGTAAPYDFNGDGYRDLAIGAPESQWVNARSMAAIAQGASGVPGAAEAGDGFGGVAIGDFTGDGYGDLAVGAPYESFGGAEDTGTVTLLRGTGVGYLPTGARALSQSTSGVPDGAESGDRVLLSDTTKDGKADLSVGGTGENGGDGAIWWLKSATTSGAKSFGPAKFGISTTGTPSFGSPLRG